MFSLCYVHMCEITFLFVYRYSIDILEWLAICSYVLSINYSTKQEAIMEAATLCSYTLYIYGVV